MTNEQLVRTWIEASERGQAAHLRAMASPDFEFEHTASHPPMDRASFGHLARAVHRAAPDLTIHATGLRGRGDVIHVELLIEGTHEAALDLTALGYGWLPPSGEPFQVRLPSGSFRIQAGRVRRVQVDLEAYGGIPGILEGLCTGRFAPEPVSAGQATAET